MIKPIKNEKEYEQALNQADACFANPPKIGTEEGDNFELLLLVIKDYEDKHYSVPVGDAVEVIKMTMQEKGLSAKDLEPYIGKKSYVSQILNRKKPLTLSIIKNLHHALNIPVKLLVA